MIDDGSSDNTAQVARECGVHHLVQLTHHSGLAVGFSTGLEACLKLGGAIVTHSDGYPGWKPNISSEILKISRTSYNKLFGKEPKIRAIHAGLECGLIYEKNKSIDMISFGPTIRGAHTPEEMINIETTQMFWDLLIDILNSVPEK